MNTELIEREIRELTPELSPDEVAVRLDRLVALKQQVKELSELFEAALFAWLAENGELTVGQIVWFIGNDKQTKCRNVKATLAALLELSGGDLDAVADCLGASAWKHGTIRRLLDERGCGEKFGELFEETIKRDVDNRPLKVVSVNKAFVK